MIRTIVSASLRFKFFVVVLAALLIAVGIGQLPAAPVDVLPEYSPPYVEIQTEALGLSAEEVEQLVTLGLEQDLLNGVPWLTSIYSDSEPGLSSILLVFEPGTNIARARQMVTERLAQAFALPHVSKPPTMLQPMSSTSRVMVVSLSSKTLTPIQMSVLARWTIMPRLLGVSGVANVAIWGQRDRQLQVLADPKRLLDNKVSLSQVLETTGNALWVSSLSFVEASTPGTGGFIDTANQRIGIRHLLPIVSPEGLSQVPIEGTKLVLGDVATIREDHQPLIGDALTKDGTGLLLVVEKFPGANALAVTRGVEEALDEMRPGMAGLDMNPNVYRPADFIETALRNIGLWMLIGMLLILLIVAAVLFEWRTTVVALVAIPVSLVAAALVLYAMKATLNIVVLSGLLAALGIVVDDALVSTVDLSQRLRAARERGGTQPVFSIVLDASLEMRGALMYALLILLLAVTPIFFLGRVAGPFFEPLAISYGLAILASMLVALTLTPALFLLLYPKALPRAQAASPLARLAQGAYMRLERTLLPRTGLAFAVAAVLVIAGLAVLPLLKTSLLPLFQERSLVVHLEGPSGMSQPEMSRISGRMAQELRGLPGIRNVSAQVGRAVFGDRIVDVNSAELWVSMDPSVDYASTAAAIRSVVGGYPGLRRTVDTYLQEASSSVMAPADQPLTVRVYGDTDAGLRASAEGIQKAIAGIPGVAQATVDYPAYMPTLQVEVELPAAQRFGVKPGDVRRAAATMFSGIQVGSLFEEQKVFDVVVWSTPESRESTNDLLNLQVDTPNGGHVRLGDVAQVRLTSAPADVKHESVHRYMDVAVAVSGRSKGAVAADVQAQLRRIQLPLEYHAEVLGDYAAQNQATTRVLFVALAALVAIFLLLQASYRSWRLAFLAILTAPVALSGAAVSILLAGGVVSLGSLAGLLIILGMVIRNGILMASRFYSGPQSEHAGNRAERILHGAAEGAAPMLASALTTAFAFLPALFLGDIPGLEIVRPMAVVVLGGVLSTMVVDLYILPALLLRYRPSREPELQLAAAPAATD